MRRGSRLKLGLCSELLAGKEPLVALGFKAYDPRRKKMGSWAPGLGLGEMNAFHLKQIVVFFFSSGVASFQSKRAAKKNGP